MPYKTIGFDTPQQPASTGWGKLVAPAVTRAAGGYLATPGGPLGFLLAGGAEGLAQLEENISDIPKAIQAIPDVVRNVVNPETREETVGGFFEGANRPMARMGVEATLGSIPFGQVIKSGAPVVSALRSSAFSGIGEAGREVARGEDLDPTSIGRASALGALFGGVFGKLGAPAKAETPPAGPSYEVEHTAVPGGRVLDNKGKLVPAGRGRTIVGEPAAPLNPREAYWANRGMNPPTAPGRMASGNYELPFGNISEESVEGAGRVPYMESGQYPAGSAAKSAARAAKEAEKTARQMAIQNRIDQAIEEGQLTPGRTAVSESGSVETPEGRMSYRTSYKAPEKEETDAESLGMTPGRRTIDETFEPLAEPAPENPSPASPLEKLLNSAQPEAPRTPQTSKILTPNQEAAQRSYDDLLARIKAEGAPAAPEAPVEPPVAPEQPSTPTNVPQEAGQSLEKVLGTTSNLERLDPTFKGFPMEPVSGGAGAEVEGATQGLNPLARLFKSRVDAAGQGYRDIKAALGAGEAVPEEGRAIAGKALAQEGRAAGLPPTPRAPVVPPAEPPVSGIGPSQTAKARAAALAKRQAAKAAASEKAARTQEWLPDFEKEVAEAQKMKAEGASTEDIIERLKKLGTEESGYMTPEGAARLGLTATGVGIGGILGGAAGHPIIGALAGGAMGASLSPDRIISGLKMLGMPDQAAAQASEIATTPEGAKAAAERIYQTLPQFSRFNYLMDLWGLPANALVGPYGSAAMAGIEAHLNGDPRGMEVLSRLNPRDFVRRWNVARQGEAQRLIEEGEIGRAETQALGHSSASKLFQWPGVQMTAGDVAARQILEEAGFSADEARRITMTSEPETLAAKRAANFSKGSPLLQMFQPFARTPANIAEQGALRVPFLGSAVQYLGRETPDPLKLQMIQQGLGLAGGAAGYALGSELDPETARIARRYLTNIAGQYSLPVGAGFALGQTMQRGGNALDASTELYNALPLPSTAPAANWVTAAKTGKVPRGFMPPQLAQLLGANAPTGPRVNPLSPIRFRTR